MAKRTKEEVLKIVKTQDVKFIRLWFTDILGQVKSFAITDNELEGALDGIEKNYKLPEPMEKNLYHLSSVERKELGIESLPDSLGEAVLLAEESKLVRQALGEHVFTRFIELKKKEWEDYRIQLTRYELDKLLPIL